MKQFTAADVKNLDSDIPSIYSESTNDFVDSPLWYHNKGLMQTASGYGSKLVSRYKINYEGKNRRVYVTCFSNSGSSWFKVRGKKIFVS